MCSRACSTATIGDFVACAACVTTVCHIGLFHIGLPRGEPVPTHFRLSPTRAQSCSAEVKSVATKMLIFPLPSTAPQRPLTCLRAHRIAPNIPSTYPGDAKRLRRRSAHRLGVGGTESDENGEAMWCASPRLASKRPCHSSPEQEMLPPSPIAAARKVISNPFALRPHMSVRIFFWLSRPQV